MLVVGLWCWVLLRGGRSLGVCALSIRMFPAVMFGVTGGGGVELLFLLFGHLGV